MIQAHVGLLEGRSLNKTKALYAAFEKDSIMRLVTNESTGLAMIEANEPEAELFALAKQVDLAEKAFHEAHARRNKAHIAYLREPNILTRGIRHTGPMAGQNSRHDGHRAQVEGVIRFDGRQARRQHHRRHLAT